MKMPILRVLAEIIECEAVSTVGAGDRVGRIATAPTSYCRNRFQGPKPCRRTRSFLRPARSAGFPPLVPQRTSRPAAGDWQPRQRPRPRSRNSLETLKGNDATIQIVVGQGKPWTLKDLPANAAVRFIARRAIPR